MKWNAAHPQVVSRVSLCLVLTWQSGMAWNMLHGIWATKTDICFYIEGISKLLGVSSIKDSANCSGLAALWLHLCVQAHFGGERSLFIGHLSGFICPSCLNTLVRLINSPAAYSEFMIELNGLNDTIVASNWIQFLYLTRNLNVKQ